MHLLRHRAHIPAGSFEANQGQEGSCSKERSLSSRGYSGHFWGGVGEQGGGSQHHPVRSGPCRPVPHHHLPFPLMCTCHLPCLNSLQALQWAVQTAPHLHAHTPLPRWTLPTQKTPIRPPSFREKFTHFSLYSPNLSQPEHPLLYCNCLLFCLPCDLLVLLELTKKKDL